MKLLTIAALLLAAGGLTMPNVLAQADVVSENINAIITVGGTGEVSVTPDIARITVGVQTRGKESAGAAAENATKTAAVIKAIRALGVAEKDIQTTGYNIYPQFDYQKQPPVLTEYQVNNSVRVTVRKIADAGKVLDAALQAGANVAGGITFDLSDPQKAKDEALAKAVKDALRKANLMTKATGIARTLQMVELIEGGQSGYEPPRPLMQEMATMARSAAPTPVEAGETKITATVTLRVKLIIP